PLADGQRVRRPLREGHGQAEYRDTDAVRVPVFGGLYEALALLQAGAGGRLHDVHGPGVPARGDGLDGRLVCPRHLELFQPAAGDQWPAPAARVPGSVPVGEHPHQRHRRGPGLGARRPAARPRALTWHLDVSNALLLAFAPLWWFSIWALVAYARCRVCSTV